MDKLQIVNNTYIDKLLKENHLDDSFLDNHLVKFSRVIESRNKCEGCNGLNECSQLSRGERLSLTYKGTLIEEIEYCDYALKQVRKHNIKNDYVYCDVPETLLDLSLEDVSFTKDQTYLYAQYLGILHKETQKGLFVSGDMGIGKTYLSAALANSLVKKGNKVAFVKVSDFFNSMKANFTNGSNNVDKTVNQLKKAEYLFLDDIGAESVSEFVRDDVLLRILDYRLENRLCTIFTSNLNKEELLKHYQYDRKEKSNLMKARRLLERIDILSEEFVLSGKNLRRNA